MELHFDPQTYQTMWKINATGQSYIAIFAQHYHLPASEEEVSRVARGAGWRTTLDGSDRDATAGLEDALQAPRLAKLGQGLPALRVAEVRYVDARTSLQDRCLLAGPQETLDAIVEERCDFEALLQACGAAGIARPAIDLRPHGLVSKRYGFDGGNSVAEESGQ